MTHVCFQYYEKEKKQNAYNTAADSIPNPHPNSNANRDPDPTSINLCPETIRRFVVVVVVVENLVDHTKLM